jgi:hypothetical protein
LESKWRPRAFIRAPVASRKGNPTCRSGCVKQKDGVAERLSVDARAPLSDILAEISRVAGVRIHLDAAVEARLPRERTTVAFRVPTLEEGLLRLLPTRNFMLGYSSDGLVEVRVYAARRPDAGSARPELTNRPGPEQPAADPAGLKEQALDNPDPRTRMSAIEQLAASGDRAAAVDALATVLEGEQDVEVLNTALAYLYEHESIPLEPVLAIAGSDRVARLRPRALDLLSARGRQDPRFSQLLRRLAGTDENEAVRATARSLLRSPE